MGCNLGPARVASSDFTTPGRSSGSQRSTRPEYVVAWNAPLRAAVTGSPGQNGENGYPWALPLVPAEPARLRRLCDSVTHYRNKPRLC